MLDMDTYEEPDAESDYDYEESYSSKRKRRKPRGGGHHPARNHPSSSDSPGGKRTKVNLIHICSNSLIQFFRYEYVL